MGPNLKPTTHVEENKNLWLKIDQFLQNSATGYNVLGILGHVDVFHFLLKFRTIYNIKTGEIKTSEIKSAQFLFECVFDSHVIKLNFERIDIVS